MYKNILVSVDLNDVNSWRKALPTAVELSQSFGCELHVIAVIPDVGMSMVGSYFPADFADKAIEGTRVKLHELLDTELPEGVKAQAIVAQGTIYHEILQTAKRLDCDLIIMASHRPGLADYLLGPNAARVVRHAKHSVLVVRN
jgi:nucleotide-binding universal stress UspA family protein